MKFNSPVSYLRVFSLLDALSFIYLLYCSIYLKHIMGDDAAINTPGKIHGVIFCFFGLALLISTIIKNWSFKTFLLIGLSSLIPFAPFWVETWLKKQDN